MYVENDVELGDLQKVLHAFGQAQQFQRAACLQRSVASDQFVVYGHDGTARTQLEAMLRRWDLEPLILDQLPSEGQTLIEKLEKYTKDDVGFGIGLARPDDEGHPRGRVRKHSGHARMSFWN